MVIEKKKKFKAFLLILRLSLEKIIFSENPDGHLICNKYYLYKLLLIHKYINNFNYLDLLVPLYPEWKKHRGRLIIVQNSSVITNV